MREEMRGKKRMKEGKEERDIGRKGRKEGLREEGGGSIVCRMDYCRHSCVVAYLQ